MMQESLSAQSSALVHHRHVECLVSEGPAAADRPTRGSMKNSTRHTRSARFAENSRALNEFYVDMYAEFFTKNACKTRSNTGNNPVH